MRKRRAILVDDDLSVLNILKTYFELKGYEVIACREPIRCPVYDDHQQCDNRRPCGDLLITDYRMPGMTGIDLLRAQARLGCRLTSRNKAIISGSPDDKVIEAIKELGCSYFLKPFTLEELDVWIQQCEERMDLDRPLGLKRKESRTACYSNVAFRVDSADDVCSGTLVDRSDSGFCIKVERPPFVNQIVDIMTDLPVSSKRAIVRWTIDAGDGQYLVGMSCC